MRLLVSALVSALVAALALIPGRSSAEILSYTLVYEEYSLIKLASVTFSGDDSDMDTWLSIYVRRNWMSGPGYNLGTNEWYYDFLENTWYVRDTQVATRSTGFWHKSGGHKKVDLELNTTEMGNTYHSKWVSQ